jgi:hypothetical protein
MEEITWLPFTEKMEELSGGFFLGNWALSGRKTSKICAHWGKDNFWYISVRTSMEKGERDLTLGT